MLSPSVVIVWALELMEKCDAKSLPAFDVYLVGSDQMWSINCVGNRIDPVYWGMFSRPNATKLIGFSISSNARFMILSHVFA